MVDTSLKSVAVRSLFPCVHSLQSLRFESNVIRTIQFHCVSEKEIYGEQKQQFFYFDLVVYALFLSTLIVGFFQACSKLPSWNTFFTSIQMDKEKKKIFEFYSTTLFAILIWARFIGWGNSIKACTICFEIRIEMETCFWYKSLKRKRTYWINM